MIEFTPFLLSGTQFHLTRVEWLVYGIGSNWILIAGLLLGFYAGLPFLVPGFH
ncbi:MAG: hypothetical protein ACYC6H_04045 [Bellilinea sp.]